MPAKKKVSQPSNLFWTKDRLCWMKEQALPVSETLADAIEKGEKRWRRKLDIRRFQAMFKRQFKKTPGKFLQAPTFTPPPEKPAVAPMDNPVFLRKELARVERELKTASEQSQVASIVKSYLHGASNWTGQIPEWVVRGGKKTDLFHGIPTLVLSDIHHGETVFPEQVEGANQFNVETSRERCERVFTKTVWLLQRVFANPRYPGIVLACGGDNFSGNIHEELRETNGMPIFDAVLDMADIMTAGIRLFADAFERVFVPIVGGNHSRLDKKPRYKYGPQDNFEYILGHIIASRFADDPRVDVAVSDAFTYRWPVYGTRYILTHGDCFRGGNGISGPILPWMLGEHKLRKQLQSISSWTKKDVEFDVILFGHWHQFFPGRSFVSNGSIKGFDEYAKANLFNYEPPRQSLILTSPEWGMTFVAPVYAVESNVKDIDTEAWIEVQSDKK